MRSDLDVAAQAGVVSRHQLLTAGWTPAQVRAQLAAGRWQRVFDGVYATFTGPLPPQARVWAAVLRSGDGAVAGPNTTLWILGVAGPPRRLDVLVPEGRRVRGTPGVDVQRCRALSERIHPTARPPRLRPEDALLDACAAQARQEAVVDLVLRVVQRRLTTADRLAQHLSQRRAHRWRGLLHDLFADVRAGVQTPLEHRWLHDVERPHGLPRSVLNHRDDSGPRRRYRDVEFVGWGLVVELDGQESHPDDERFRDRRRDNAVTVSGRLTLRYGWHEIVEDGCGVAGEVAGVLRSLGWPGPPYRCNPTCRLQS